MGDLRDFESELQKLLTRLEPKSAFSEVFAQRHVGQSARMNRRETTPASQARLHGAALRSWGGTRWVEAATSDLGPQGLEAAYTGVERRSPGSPTTPLLRGVAATGSS